MNHETVFVRFGACRFRVQRWNKPESTHETTLVMLHGFTGDGLDFEALAEQLDVTTIIAPDLLGHGGTSAPESPLELYTIPQQLVQLEHLLDSLGAHKPHLLGYSMGGRIALQMAVHFEDHFRSLTLIGGPIDPEANATDVTDFGRRVTMGQLEETMIQQVGFKYPGVGRKVYPGLLQLTSFMSMNAERHATAFSDQIGRVARGEASDRDPHNKFYDEYLAVMDMPAEFYLSTVKRIFKDCEIARNDFSVEGRKIDIGKITKIAVKTVEGGKDDISAPGQCVAALDLLTGLPADKKASYVEPNAGHYGIFAGRSWRENIRPLVLDFIDANSEAPAERKRTKPRAKHANKNAAA